MILSKDVQEILEGVHYFLAEALQRESLSGRAECLRRGLVLQLEGLAGAYPALRIPPASPGGMGGAGVRGPGSSASLPYLPMNQTGTTSIPSINIGGTTTTATTTGYSSSSSGVNSSGNSSSGSSGDGFVGGSRVGGGSFLPSTTTTTTTTTAREGGSGDGRIGGDGEEMYEEFDDFTEDEGVDTKPAGVGGGKEEGEDKEEDGVYMETDEPIAFSSLIASCERHGPLGKKTKGLLRQVKPYLCVAANGSLYLYLKETDDSQKKTIDLTGYVARAATGEEIKDARKRDAAFEIVCPGKKTHTFIARTARDKNDWVAALSRTIRSGRARTPFTPTTTTTTPHTEASPAQVTIPSRPTEKAPRPPQPEEYKYYHDVAEEIHEELYEEIQGEAEEGEGGGASFFPPPPTSLLSPSPIPPAHPPGTTSTDTTSLPDYEAIEPEDTPSSAVTPARPPPPARPPLPQHLQIGGGGRKSVADEDEGNDSDDGIYCEISEDILDAARKADAGLLADGGWGGGGTALAPPQPPRNQSSTPTTPTSQVGALSEEVFSKLPSFSKTPSHSGLPHIVPLKPATPPRLPPKGVAPPECDDDSEYKVPQGANMEYQVPPSNPIQVGAKPAPGSGLGTLHGQLTDRLTARLARKAAGESGDDGNKKDDGDTTTEAKDEGPRGKDGSVKVISGPLIPKVTPTQAKQSEILPIRPSSERKPSLKMDKPLGVSSFLGKGDGGDKGDDGASNRPIRSNATSTSVKDMIARLNQNKSSLSSTATTTAPTPTTTAPDTTALPKQNLRPEKPATPPRPENLGGGSPQPPFMRPKEEQPEEVEEELYAELAEGSTAGGEEATSRIQEPEPIEEELYAELAEGVNSGVEDKATGEWYVAKFAFVATLPQALSFGRGDEVFVYDRTGDSGWWRASLRGKDGLVPREYLKLKQ